MANIDFYALGDDLRSLLRFVYAETDVVIYELSSEFDCDVRRFASLAALEAAFNLDGHKAGNLQLWSPSVMARPVIRRIELKVPGHSFRYAVEGAGLIQLYLDGERDNVIYHTHYGHWNEAGARHRSIHSADDCDWQALARMLPNRRREPASGFLERTILPYRAAQGGIQSYAPRGVLTRNCPGACDFGLRAIRYKLPKPESATMPDGKMACSAAAAQGN